MKSMSKVLNWLIIFSVLMLFAACGNSNTSAPTDSGAAASQTPVQQEPTPKDLTPVEVTWAMQGAANELEGWQAMADVANEKLKDQSISVKIQKINTNSWDEYYQKITAQMAAGNIPDIGRIAESLMPQVISKDQVVELTPYMNEIDKSQYFEGLFNNAGNQGGKLFGLPSGVYQKIMYYNKDLFDKKGIAYPSSDWDNPITLEQLAEISKKLTEGTGANKKFGYFSEFDIYMIGAMAGENIYGTNGYEQLTDSHKKVFDYYNTMINQDKSMPTPVDTKIMGGMDMFRAGKVAMIYDGTWWHQAARDIKDFKVGIAAAPMLQGKAGSSSFIDNFVIWKGTKHEKEAWEALKAIFSEEGFDALAKTGTGGIPVNRGTLEKLQDQLIGTSFDEQDKKSFMQALDHTVPMPYNTSFNEVSQKAASILEPFMVGKKNTDETISALKEYLEGLAK